MRPTTLDEVVGQEALVGSGAPLRRLLERGEVPSLLLWGPPGSGKSTVAAVIAAAVRAVRTGTIMGFVHIPAGLGESIARHREPVVRILYNGSFLTAGGQVARAAGIGRAHV